MKSMAPLYTLLSLGLLSASTAPLDPLRDCLAVPAPVDCNWKLAEAPESTVFWRGEQAVFYFEIKAGAKETKIEKPQARVTLAAKRSSHFLEAQACLVTFVAGKGGVAYPDVLAEGLQEMTIGPKTHAYLCSTFQIPTDINPGDYQLLVATKVNGKRELFEQPFTILPATLPSQRTIHLDIWQHPEAIARVAGVPLWSREHLDAAKPYMQRLAAAGQKAITCSIIEEPWGHQTYDDWSSMIKWTQTKAGGWTFNYTAFDTWTDFMINEIGITGQISCYTMIPWSMQIAYYDEASSSRQQIKLDPSTPQFDEVWGAFLTDFRHHLKKRGLLEKTCIALDERPDAMTKAAFDAMTKYAPELKIVSANDHPTSMSDAVYDISPVFQQSGGSIPELAEKRRADGRKTTFYVCCNPPKPNTFTHSHPAEAHWLGFYMAAHKFDGFLRWAYNSWNENPFASTSFGNWPAGDCFLTYPGNLSTVHWESLCNGFEDFEKIRILREAAEKTNAGTNLKRKVKELDHYLKETFSIHNGMNGNDHTTQVQRARELLNVASKEL